VACWLCQCQGRGRNASHQLSALWQEQHHALHVPGDHVRTHLLLITYMMVPSTAAAQAQSGRALLLMSAWCSALQGRCVSKGWQCSRSRQTTKSGQWTPAAVALRAMVLLKKIGLAAMYR